MTTVGEIKKIIDGLQDDDEFQFEQSNNRENKFNVGETVWCISNYPERHTIIETKILKSTTYVTWKDRCKIYTTGEGDIGEDKLFKTEEEAVSWREDKKIEEDKESENVFYENCSKLGAHLGYEKYMRLLKADFTMFPVFGAEFDGAEFDDLEFGDLAYDNDDYEVAIKYLIEKIRELETVVINKSTQDVK